jgi:CRP-like cAMP-binding protein
MLYKDVCVKTSKTGCLSSTGIFRDLTHEQLALFETILESQTFAAGGTVYKENDKADCLYIVKEGKVSLRFSLEVNTGTIRPIVQTVYRNGFLGESEFIDFLPRSATAIAEETTELIRVKRSQFCDVIDNNPEAGYIVMKNFNKILSTRIRRSNKQLQTALIMGWNAYKFDKY